MKSKKNADRVQNWKNEQYYFFPFTHGEQIEGMKDEMNQHLNEEYMQYSKNKRKSY